MLSLVFLNSQDPSTVFGVAANAQYVHRQATIEDLPALIKHTRNLSEEDRTRLLVLPDEMLSSSLSKSILKGRYFVTIEETQQQIVSYLKAYLVEDREELDDFMVHEMRSIGSAATELLRRSYNFPTLTPLKQVLQKATDNHTPCYQYRPQEQAYIYYGGAYTLEGYRGKNLNNQLLAYGLQLIQVRLDQRLRTGQVKNIGLIYGQVDANLGNLSMLSPFSQALMLAFDLQQVQLHHYRFLTYKPEITYNQELQRPESRFPESGKGAGNIVLFFLDQLHRPEENPPEKVGQ